MKNKAPQFSRQDEEGNTERRGIESSKYTERSEQGERNAGKEERWSH